MSTTAIEIDPGPILREKRAGARQHLYVLWPSLVVLSAFFWLVTYGDFTLFRPEQFGLFYDAQAKSLLHGCWNVPRESIYPEEFIRDGNAYGYFGFAPSLPRMALNQVFPQCYGRWSKFSVLMGCAATLALSYRILLRSRLWFTDSTRLSPREKFAYGSALLLVGLGTTTIYLGARAFIYHEAIVWAVVMALATYDQLLGYLLKPRLGRLALAGVFSFLCFFCRISTGCGPLLAIVLLGISIAAARLGSRPNRPAALLRSGNPARVDRPESRWLGAYMPPPSLTHAALAMCVAVVISGAFVAINHAKFNTWIEAAPMRYHMQVITSPGRLERTGGKWLRLANVPSVAYAYFSPGSILFHHSFPWVYLQPYMRLFRGCRMDGWGPFSSVTTAMPVLLILAVVGAFTLWPKNVPATTPRTDVLGAKSLGATAAIAATPDAPRVADMTQHARSPRAAAGQGQSSPNGRPPSPAILVLGSLGALAPLLAFSNVDNRYLHDFLPSLLLLAVFGLHRLLALRRSAMKRLLAALLILLGLFEIYANCAFAVEYQRLMVWNTPREKKQEMERVRHAIDDYLNPLFNRP